MLSCWAASKDVNNMGACAESAKAVAECMRNSVWFSLLSLPSLALFFVLSCLIEFFCFCFDSLSVSPFLLCFPFIFTLFVSNFENA